MKISFVLAMSKNRVIGVNNKLPWRVPTDMQRFTDLTTGHPVIMGSKTFESLPSSHRPLPDRTNIVLTRDSEKQFEGAHTVTSLAEAIRLATTMPGGEEIMVIGGGQIFREALPLTQTIYLTEIDTVVENGDAFFPELDSIRWSVVEEGSFSADKKNQFGGTFYTYTRTGNMPIVEPGNGRNEEYRAQLQGILDSGICPFCPDGETLREQQILHENATWLIKENAHPLANALYHFVLWPKRHIESVDDLTVEEFTDLLEMRRWMKENYPATGDAMYARSGELKVTGATVAHLHWHSVVPAGLVTVNFGDYYKQ